MATFWNQNVTIGAGDTMGWSFAVTDAPGFLPYFSIQPLSGPESEFVGWALTGGGYPYQSALGISTQWCTHPPDEAGIAVYFICVQNNSTGDASYSIVEASF
jgi:hypothetical protein